MAKVVICGRPNVGKSTLFNRLSGKNMAMIHDRPGVTRDWVHSRLEGLDIDLLDTAGMADSKKEDELANVAWETSLRQIEDADLVLLVVDGRAGLLPMDQAIVSRLRRLRLEDRIVLVINKTESLEGSVACSEFHSLGLSTMIPISASHSHGLQDLREILDDLDKDVDAATSETEEVEITKIAIVGRPNVGKSTLANKLLGESRMIVADRPGTTIDNVIATLNHKGKQLALIDTAGIRRKARVIDPVETRSSRNARLAAEQADVVVFMADASEGVVHQDQLLANLIAGYGRATIVLLNKADLIDPSMHRKTKAKAKRELPFMEYAHLMLESVNSSKFDPAKLLNKALEAHEQATMRFSPNKISKSLKAATDSNEPPRSHGKRPRLRYAHQAGTNPPLIVIHGRHVNLIKEPYMRYLVNRFISDLGFKGAPLHLRLKESESKAREAQRA